MKSVTPLTSTFTHPFWAGVRACLPLAIGVLPFGLIYGVLALQAGLSQPAAQAMSSIIFAGSAQFITVELVRQGIPGALLVLTILVVNLRHMLYSLSVAPHIQHLSRGWKAALAYLLTDEAYAVIITFFNNQPKSPQKHWYFLGAGLTLWSGWQISTAGGIFLGVVIPASWSLEFSATLMFIALAAPTIKNKPTLAAALVAGVTALLAFGLPLKLGLLAAAGTGLLAGALVERFT
jgi:4-azaleucine resistance transporter AzlC